ncbi:DUF2190 family protein [Citreimonas sp.]|uniref:DUF2190 family protein n=1 Tax=Citreimonas sp. TaxID=3036715 RepID=UPI004058E636
MKNFIQEGARLTIVAAAAVASGAGVLTGSLFGVALTSADSGDEVELQLTGVVELTKVGSQAWSVGDRVYWDDGNSRCTTTAADGDLLIGTCAVAVGGTAGATTGTVRLSPGPYPVAANVADASSGSAAEINAIRDALVDAGLMAAS